MWENPDLRKSPGDPEKERGDMVGVQHNKEASGSDATHPPVIVPTPSGRGALTYTPPNFLGLEAPQTRHSALPRVWLTTSRPPKPPPRMQSQSGSVSSSPGASKRQSQSQSELCRKGGPGVAAVARGNWANAFRLRRASWEWWFVGAPDVTCLREEELQFPGSSGGGLGRGAVVSA